MSAAVFVLGAGHGRGCDIDHVHRGQDLSGRRPPLIGMHMLVLPIPVSFLVALMQVAPHELLLAFGVHTTLEPGDAGVWISAIPGIMYGSSGGA